MSIDGRQRGLTLIELIVFIVIVGVALAGVLSVFNIAVRNSADPMVRKQMLAVAESLLEEVQLKAFTYCDPDDSAAATATGAADCTGGAGGANDESTSPLGPESGETRTSTSTPFDNVSDYNGLALASPIASLNGSFTAPAGISASIAVATDAALGPASGLVPASDALRITVTVSYGSESIQLVGYRTRYAPTALP